MDEKKVVKSDAVKKLEKQRWVVWGVLAIVYVFVTFHRMSPAAVKDQLQSTFNIGVSEFAQIGSMYFWAYFIMQIPSGILADKIGPKKTTIIFTFIAAVGSLMFGLAPTIQIAYIGRLLVGFGVSVVFICLVKIQSNWFYSKNFALMIGVLGLAANLGAILAQSPLVLLTNAIGWRKTFIYLGILTFIFVILVFIFVKDKPEDIGLPSISELENRPIKANNSIKVSEALKSVLSNPRTWVISFGYIGLYTGYIVFMGTYGMSLLMNKYNLTKVEAGNYVIAAIIGAAIAGLVIGGLSDKYKNRKGILIVCSLLTLACWILLVYFTVPKSILMIFLFIFGFVISSFTLSWTLGNEVNDRRLGGIATGVVNCIGFLGAAIIPVVMGKIIDNYKMDLANGYKKAFTVLIVVVAISTIANFFVPESHATNIYEEK